MKPRPDHITFRVNPETKDKLKQLAAADERTLSQLVSIIVERYVSEHTSPKTDGDGPAKKKR
jgi:predicted DNA-binding protein